MKKPFPQPCHTDRTADRAAPRPGELLTLLVTQAFLRLAQVRRGRQQTRPGAPGPRLLGGRVHDELRARRADELHILGAHVAHDAPEVAALVGPEHRDGGAGLACAASAAGAVQERLRVLGQVVVHHLRARATLHRVGIHLELHYALREARRAQRGARGGRRRPPTVRHRSMDTLASVADQRACRRRARPAFDSPHSVTPDIMEQATNGRSILDGTPACRPDKTTAGARRRTRSTSEMSRPRAATSVATSATNLPSRKCRSTVSRCFCEMSPCSACRPARRRISAGSSRRFNKRVGVRNVAVHRASRRAQPHKRKEPCECHRRCGASPSSQTKQRPGPHSRQIALCALASPPCNIVAGQPMDGRPLPPAGEKGRGGGRARASHVCVLASAAATSSASRLVSVNTMALPPRPYTVMKSTSRLRRADGDTSAPSTLRARAGSPPPATGAECGGRG